MKTFSQFRKRWGMDCWCPFVWVRSTCFWMGNQYKILTLLFLNWENVFTDFSIYLNYYFPQHSKYIWYVCGCEFEYKTLFLLNSKVLHVFVYAICLLTYRSTYGSIFIPYCSVRYINSQLKRIVPQSFRLVNLHSDKS